MSFFYDLNKKLDGIRATPEVTHQQLNERDMGKHNNATTGFKALAKKAGGGEKGEKIAGAQFQKMKKAGQLEEGPLDENLLAQLRDRGNIVTGQKQQDRKNFDPNTGAPLKANSVTSGIRARMQAGMQNKVQEGPLDAVKSIGKKVAGGINKLVGHGSDEDMRKDLQRKSGAPVTGKKPTPPQQVKEKMSPAKQQSFAALAAPKDKITFADKIAGAKKEVDEMLGDVAAEAMRGALSGGQKKLDKNHNGKLDANDFAMLRKGGKNAEMDEAMPPRGKMTPSGKMTPKKFKAVFNGPLDWPRIVKFKDRLMGQGMEPEEAEQEAAERLGFEYEEVLDYLDLMNSTNEENDFTAHQRPSVVQPKVGSTERGHKHDIKHTATGRMVTRRTDDQGNSVGADDDSAASGEKRGRGRPKGTKQSIGAKGPSGKSKLMTREGDVDVTDQGEYDQEGDMAKDDIKTIVRHAQALSKVLGDDDNLPEWVQSKLAKIEGMMISIDEYMQNQAGDDEMAMGEEKTGQRDDHAEKAGKKVTKDIEYDEKKKDGIHGKKRGAEDAKAEKAGKKVAKDIEYDEKKKEKEVDESTTSGSVATSTATKGGGGGVYGKGIYDSMNRELENMIAESMSINMSDSTEGGKSLTITATDEDALKLGMMLKNAGLGGDQHGGDMHSPGEEPCDTCGMPDCGCGDVQEAVDENAPDWPTNTETSPDALQYAGGLNKPKTDVAGDGQTTIPNTAVHTQDEDALRRMMEMAGIKQAELEPWKETMKEEEEDFFHNPNVPADKQLPAPPKEVELEEELEEDFLESIQRMREIAGIKEAKKDVDEEKTEEGNLFTGNLAKARADGKKQADLDGDGDMEKVRESIFTLTNQWKAYRG